MQNLKRSGISIDVSGLRVSYDGNVVLDGLDWHAERGEGWKICGKSGTGKTSLLKAVAGKIKFGGKVELKFYDDTEMPSEAYYVDNWYRFESLDGDKNFYYQQRYNKQEENETLTVYAELMRFGRERGLDYRRAEPLLEKFGFMDCRHRQLLELSSGEHKKLQLVCALWLRPQILLLDEPYVGLDKLSRKNLNELLDALIGEGATVAMVTNDPESPERVRRYAKIEGGKLVEVDRNCSEDSVEPIVLKPVPYFLQKSPKIDSPDMLTLKNVTVRYGQKTVLHDISWSVKAGQKWLLQGRNGSGKSTLLSLLDGDHPQAYSSDISLFGRKRGSGESIWDIKEKIGIISPELHWYFDPNATVWNSVASGLKDTIGWFLDVSYDEQKQIESLLDFFGLLDVSNRLLSKLPLGKQRLALLARVIVKNPQLMILDEPCQGLDTAQTRLFNDILDAISPFGKTLIYVGHYETQLPKCLDHKLELDQGRVIYNGSI